MKLVNVELVNKSKDVPSGQAGTGTRRLPASPQGLFSLLPAIGRWNYVLGGEEGQQAGAFLQSNIQLWPCWGCQIPWHSTINWYSDWATLLLFSSIPGKVCYSFHRGNWKYGKSLVQLAFDLEQCQSIFATEEANHGATAVLRENIILLDSVMQTVPTLPAAAIFRRCITSEFSPKVCILPLKKEKPSLMRSGKWRNAYWGKSEAKKSLMYSVGALCLYNSVLSACLFICRIWPAPSCFNTCSTGDIKGFKIRGLRRLIRVV